MGAYHHVHRCSYCDRLWPCEEKDCWPWLEADEPAWAHCRPPCAENPATWEVRRPPSLPRGDGAMTRRFSTDGAEHRLAALFASPPAPRVSAGDPDDVDAHSTTSGRTWRTSGGPVGARRRAPDRPERGRAPIAGPGREPTPRGETSPLTKARDGGPWIIGAVLDGDGALVFSAQFDPSRATS